jgi:4-hydroxybenzoate polyprenyltransferase
MPTDVVTERASLKQREQQRVSPAALVVDLDGSLVKTDLFLESLLALVKQSPACLFKLPVWFLRGPAHFKQQVTLRTSLDASSLPYREALLEYLKRQRAEGRTIVLATGSDHRIAQKVAEHLKLFDLVLASDGTTNLTTNAKRNRLVHEFGEHGFDCVRDIWGDLPVWGSARNASVINPAPRPRSRLEKLARVHRVFAKTIKGIVDHVKPFRLQHWVKNLLIIAPLLASHRLNEGALVAKAVLAFLAFGCFASAGYVMNDLLDLTADRHHPRKRSRPFAAGDLPLVYGLLIIPVLIGLGSFIASLISSIFLAIALTYYAVSALYSLCIKNMALLDVIVLAGLYTLRIIAGSAAVVISPSPWLLASSIFLFFSLALVKRYSELTLNHGAARGYEFKDRELIESMGVASGYAAIVVLAFYINTEGARVLYQRYGLLWLLCPLVLYWISHIWLRAHRGNMSDDPLVFAARDRTSRTLMLIMLTIAVLAL